ncbi:hypothetical protein LCGC14_1116670 [marine sediment metagenome]|uniref:Uncharacterized protein n=1 Tax=marine sediment metagenome TaxID=412755 RepID=A0A0F9MT25_9ZZZZ
MSDEQDTLKKLIEIQRRITDAQDDLAERVQLVMEPEIEDEEIEPTPLGEPDQSE